LDNQFRYLCGVYTAVTIGLWYAIPAIERHGEVVRIVGAGVFIGAIGRLLSMRSHGDPGEPTMVIGVLLEGVVVPLLLLWQARVARIYGRDR
ncbi:MAG: DUF4345 domain-containing protein, partial [Myxococcales bacterium]|nr:DUF4345 domain-containing protein [Myxococcales bacterium]